jgi:nucleotide-binding universal stress UspA family protein
MDNDAGTAPHGIVVGVDGSPGSDHALRWALEEAAVREAQVRAVHAWAPPTSYSSIAEIVEPDEVEPHAAAALEVAEAAVAKAMADLGLKVDIEASAVRGYVPEVLMAESADAALLVVGTRGRGGFRGLLLGSVSQQCATHAACPVAVIHEHAALPDGDDVLVGVDGSTQSRRALDWAIDEAARRNARLTVVQAWSTPVPAPPAGLVVTPIDPEAFRASAEDVLSSVTDEALAAARRRPPDVNLVAVEQPPPVALLNQAKDANLLVVGARGLGGFKGLLLGSVSQQCIHHAPCAVVVVPHPAAG